MQMQYIPQEPQYGAGGGGTYPPLGYQQPQYGQPQYSQPQQQQQQQQATCPPGLEYLVNVDQLLVHQAVNLMEVFTSLECKNKFAVKNSMGQQVYFAAEESGFCMRQCCNDHRGFVMHVADNTGQEVLRVMRDFKCCAGCCWCAGCCDACAYEVVVEAPPGNPIGYVKQAFSLWKPQYNILDSNKETTLTMTGPCCIISCPCFDLDFDLYSEDGVSVGRVSKQWSGVVREMFTEAENFGITFPMDLDVRMKATLLGAVFLINMMYFEQRQDS